MALQISAKRSKANLAYHSLWAIKTAVRPRIQWPKRKEERASVKLLKLML